MPASNVFQKRRAIRGFSLLELMTVVAIIGILFAIAVPSYNSYIVKSTRNAAKSYLLTIVNKEEQILLDARQYATASSNAELSSNLGLTVPSEVSSYYTVTVANVSGNTRTYRAQAVPIAGTRQASDGTLAIDNTGTKTGNW